MSTLRRHQRGLRAHCGGRSARTRPEKTPTPGSTSVDQWKTPESRGSSKPVLRLLECCQESDGGFALVAPVRNRARDLSQTPAISQAAASAAHTGEMMTSYYATTSPDYPRWRRRRPALRDSGLKPPRQSNAFIYDLSPPFRVSPSSRSWLMRARRGQGLRHDEEPSLGGHCRSHQRRLAPARPYTMA